MSLSGSSPTPPPNDIPFHFEVHPSVLFKLGEDLITDDAQALVELAKNAYDADARVVRIEVTTDKYYDPLTGHEVDYSPTEEYRLVCLFMD